MAASLTRALVLGDVGARWGPESRWRSLCPPVLIHAFEPDEEECARLAAAGEPGIRYVPAALGARQTTGTLHVTRDPACSSLYAPDPEVIEAHPILEVSTLEGTRNIELQTLDVWAKAGGVTVDVLKLDVQGAELDVLQGAEDQLKNVVMLEVEVEFNPIYNGQPLFGDVDRFLRDRGFMLWRLAQLVHYGRRGLRSDIAAADFQAFDSRTVPIDSQGGQLFWAHAYFVAADVLARADRDRCDRAAIAAHAFGYDDLAEYLLDQSG